MDFMSSNQLTQMDRTRRLRGVAFPGIINNFKYFLMDLEVFEDGVVNCWRMLDLPLFKESLQIRWVVTEVPEGEFLSHHELGELEVRSPQWVHTPHSLFAYVDRLVSELNPQRENLFDCHGSRTTKVNGLNTYKLSMLSLPCKETQSLFGDTIKGTKLVHFRRNAGDFYLVNVSLYKDDTVSLNGPGRQKSMTFHDFARELENSDIFDIPKPGDRLHIENLGSFTIGPKSELVALVDLNGQVHLDHDRITGKPDALFLCAEAFKDYCANPTRETRESLRQAYEAIPSHLQMYVLKDQDVKDIPIRIAVYGENEIEGWSHYQIAKRNGDELPSIEVPKVKDEH